MKRLARLYGVNHFIVSQTNPLALPFISTEKRKQGVWNTISQTALGTMKDWGLAAAHLLQRPISKDAYARKFIDGYISLVSQTYIGDINILPSSRFLSPAKILAARSSEEVMTLLAEGERQTWPLIERIRIQTHISRTLNRLVEELESGKIKGKRAAHPKRKKNGEKLKVVGE